MRLLPLLLLLACVPAATADIAKLDWLSGCWSYDGREAGSGEIWMPPAGGTLFAMSRIVKDSETVAFEYLQIKTTENGTLTLIASPSGQQTASFELLQLVENAVTFENSDHDFPQRILYRRSDDQLLGRIEGVINGEEAAMDFPMTRVDCEAFGQ